MLLLEAWDTRDDDNFLGTGNFSRELYARLRHTRRFIVFATVFGIHVLIWNDENRFEIQRDAFGTHPFRTRSHCRCRDRFGNTTTHLHRCRTSRIRAASSRERTTRLVTKLSPRSAALSRQRYIGRNSSESPTGMRVDYEDCKQKDHPANLRSTFYGISKIFKVSRLDNRWEMLVKCSLLYNLKLIFWYKRENMKRHNKMQNKNSIEFL